MSLAAGKRRLLLGGALALTLSLSAWLSLGMDQANDEAVVVEAAKPDTGERQADGKNRPHRIEPLAALVLPTLAEARAISESRQQAADIFKPHRWFVPPAPTPSGTIQAAVATPSPPPLPFTYLGTMQEGGRTVVFLAREQHLYTVRKGEVFAGQYRLEEEGDNRIELVYLPLNAKQTLVIKGAS